MYALVDHRVSREIIIEFTLTKISLTFNDYVLLILLKIEEQTFMLLFIGD